MHSPDSSSASRPADEILAGTAGGDEVIDYSLPTSEICRQMVEKQLKKLRAQPDSSTPPLSAFEFADGQNRRISATARRATAKPSSKRVVCVRNLPQDCLEADLIKTLQHAEYFGNISYVDIIEERSGELVGFVEFATGDLADKCLRQSQARVSPIKVKGQAIQIVCQTKFNTELPRRTGAESAAPTKILYLQIIANSPAQKITVRDILAICSEAELSNVLRIAIEPDQTSLIVEAFVEFPHRDAATKAKFALNGQDLFSAVSALQPDKTVIGTINVAEYANMLVVEFPEAANLDDHYDAEEATSLDPPANCPVAEATTIKQEEEDVQFLYECPGRKEESPPDIEQFPSEGAASDEALPAAVVMATNHSAPPPQSIEVAAISIVTVQAELPAASLSAPLPIIEAATTTISTDQATQNDQFAAIEPMASCNEESLVAVKSTKSALPISPLDLEQSSANADCFALAIETEATGECTSVDTSFGPDSAMGSQTKHGIALPTVSDTATPTEDSALVTVANCAFGASCGNDECADEDALSVSANRGAATPTPTAAFLSPIRNSSTLANKIASGDLSRASISLVPDYGDSPVASRVPTPAPATPLPEIESIPLPPSDPATDCAEKRSHQSVAASDVSQVALPSAKRSKSKRVSDALRSEPKHTIGTVVPSAYDPWPFTTAPPVFYSSIIQYGPEPAPGFGLHKPRAVLKVFGVDVRIANCDHLFNLFSLYGNVVKIKCLRPFARYSETMSALVQMGDAVAAQRAKEHLEGVVLFGRQLAISHFKDDFVEQPDRFGVLHTLQSDCSRAFKDYSECPFNRFSGAMAYKRLRISYPKNSLVFYGPPMMTEESLGQMLHEFAAPMPTSIKVWSSQYATESHGRLTFSGPGPAVDAIAIANNAQIPAFLTDGFTYSLRLSFLGGLQFEANGSLVPEQQPSWPIRAPAAIVDAPTANISNGGGSADQAVSSGVADMDIE